MSFYSFYFRLSLDGGAKIGFTSMEDKRSTQLVLPLGLTYEPKHKDIVKQHWNVTFARQGRMSVSAKRIMARVIDQIRDDDFKLRPLVIRSVS